MKFWYLYNLGFIIFLPKFHSFVLYMSLIILCFNLVLLYLELIFYFF